MASCGHGDDLERGTGSIWRAQKHIAPLRIAPRIAIGALRVMRLLCRLYMEQMLIASLSVEAYCTNHTSLVLYVVGQRRVVVSLPGHW